MQLILLISLISVTSSLRLRIASQMPWDEEAPKDTKLAVLIAGQLSRFLHKESFQHVEGHLKGLVCGANKTEGCIVDVYIVLADTNAAPWSSCLKSPPYESTKQTIESFFKELGANHVDIQIIPEKDLNQQMVEVEELVATTGSKEQNISSEEWWQQVKKIPNHSRRYKPNGHMFWVRHAAYVSALSSKASSGYSHFLFLREDNAFVNPIYAVKDIIKDVPLDVVMVDQFCGYGSYSDKIYLAGRKGADILFAPSREEHVRRMTGWLNRAIGHKMTKLKEDPLQTESWLQHLLDSSEIHVQPFDFGRTEVRYVGDDRPCASKVYYSCTRAPGEVFSKCRC